jgi:CDP-paratose synthetase
MRILLTGATGFIGKHLYSALKKRNYEIVVLARSSSDTTSINTEDVIFFEQSIEGLAHEIGKKRLDGIIHLATHYVNQHRFSDIDRMVESNITYGIKILELAKKLNVSWFINTGTLFEHYNSENYNPVNLYAATKHAFQEIAKYYTETCGLNFVTLKLNDTYGPGDTRKKIINIWLEYAKSGKTLSMSPGNQEIELLYIDDVVEGYLILIKLLEMDRDNSHCGKEYALPATQRLTLKQLALIFEEAVGMPLNIKWGEFDYRYREVMKPAKNLEPLPGWRENIILQRGFINLFESIM